jgi:2-polyprenyl-3-methyl-5-hydroxy-6-metoxy-1,4-benzoquinol methylase
MLYLGPSPRLRRIRVAAEQSEDALKVLPFDRRASKLVALASKLDHVKAVFAQPEWYLRRAHNIRIRKETVQTFLKGVKVDSILDIGCGDGSISLPLVNARTRLTLLDLSESMLAIARSRIPLHLSANVEIVNGDFLTAELGAHSYDLILCIGVLAHVDSPSATIDEIIRLLRPGGMVVIENTDSRHPISHVLRMYDNIRAIFLRPKYARNLVSTGELQATFGRRGCKLLATYRYSLPLPGMQRVFADGVLYKMTRFIHGAHPDSRLPWLGNEGIHLFRSDDVPFRAG